MEPNRAFGASAFRSWKGFLLFLFAVLCAAPAWATTYYWNRNSNLTGNKDFSRAYNWTVNADGTGAYAPSSMDDDFSSNNVGSNGSKAWTYLDSVSDGNSSYSVSSGQLSLIGRGADVWGAQQQIREHLPHRL